jgi:hypothetical protein
MATRELKTFLFLLNRPSIEARRAAAEQLREQGMLVIAQFGRVAVEARGTIDQADAATARGAFAARLSGAMSDEYLAKLSDEQRNVVSLWNYRFTNAARSREKDQLHLGKPWNAEGLAPSLGASIIDPEDFYEAVREYESRTKQRLAPQPAKSPRTRERGSRMIPKEFVDFERDLAKTYKDETIAYHLARLGYRLSPEWRSVLLKLPPDLLDWLWTHFFLEPACWEMTGEMSVGIVFVESSQKDGPKFSNSERNAIAQEIFDGHSWLTEEHPSGNLSWVYDLQYTKIDVANGSGDPDEGYWRDPAMAQVKYMGNTYAGTWGSVADYRTDMRNANRSVHAFVIFVTPYANSWHAYAGGARVTLANKNNWGGWGQATIDRITAHETSHLFGSADEYTGSGTPCSSCTTVHGCDKIPNGNCGSCASPQQDCVMSGNSRRLCGYTRGQIGWSHLFVETKTADILWAGTDDDVWIDIGDFVFTLDTSDWDDRERGHVEAYPIWAPYLKSQDIKRILIRKSEDGFAGGWRLERVRVWFEGQIVCEANNINKWLEDDHRVWVGCIKDRDFVNGLRIKISTADVSWAGTDDDVTLTLEGRNWNLDNAGHDDFERGNTDTFDLDPGTGLRRSEIHSIRIHKSPDGFAGGWKLKGVELMVNGTTLYNNQSINKWLEDDNRTWSASF